MAIPLHVKMKVLAGMLAAAVTVPLLSAAAPVNTGSGAAPGPEKVSLPVAEAIDSLPERKEDRSGYKRTSFKLWSDANRDGCNTRKEVLIDEAVNAPDIGPKCQLTGGRWLSYYDERSIDKAGGLDIDHVVPLAEAWDSGAHAWSPEKRERYANDLDSKRSLTAVSARSNRQKADRDPAEWWVPTKNASCQYLADWTSTKMLAPDRRHHGTHSAEEPRQALPEHPSRNAHRRLAPASTEHSRKTAHVSSSL